MNIYFDGAGTPAGLDGAIKAALRDGAGGLVVLAGDENKFKPAVLDPLLKAVDAPLIGGVFPCVIHGGAVYPRGSVVLGFKGPVFTAGISGLSSGKTDLETPIQDLEAEASGAHTMIVFIDAFSRHTTPFINSLFDIFGLEINYVGGGAGSLAHERKPCLLSNSGMTEDGAVMALVSARSGIGVAHGWKAVSEPMQATGTDGNLLKTIDFQPALDVYSAIIARDTGFIFEKKNFLKLSRPYPFGIARIGREMIIRDPHKLAPDGALVCAGEIPQDSYIAIMKGDRESLITAAGDAARMAVSALPGGKPDSFLLMDCVSRSMFLGDDFKEELARMTPSGLISAGACTIGEIANNGAEFLEFYNKTAVVAAMGKI